MRYDQTACLAVVNQPAAEEHSRDQHTRRHLIEKAKRVNKNGENQEDSTANKLQMLWNFYSSKRRIFREFSNKNQLIWILNAKDVSKTILLSLKITNCYYSHN